MPRLFRRFPVQVMLGALLFYGLTLSRGVTSDSLALTSKLAGWAWVPMVSQPLLWLLTLPLRLLPGAWIPWGANFFSALCGAAMLGLLARSLELLPWARPLNAPAGWRARLPFVLAIAACGLEWNFWQASTAATGEMLDALLPAAAAWCVLEYRVIKNLRWLQASALFWGLGLAESWVMQITLPLYLLALVLLLKRRVLRLPIILPLAGCLLAGLSVYALLPLANWLTPGATWNWAEAWSNSWQESAAMLAMIHRGFWLSHRLASLTTLLFFLLPLAALLMRRGNEDPKNTSPLEQSQIWIFRGVSAGLLLVSAWLAFDPSLGPRRLLVQQMNVELPLLTFDFLNALALGFLAGNLLRTLVVPVEIRRRRKLGRQLTEWISRATVPALAALTLVLVLGLAARNGPAIHQINRHSLAQFGEFMRRSLPPGGGIVASDFPDKLAVLQASLAQHHDRAWLAVDISALPLRGYREHWQRFHGISLPAATNASVLTPDDMLAVMRVMMQSNRVFYVHPSFGYFFEWFYQQPAGLVFEMQPIPADTYSAPKLTAEIIAQNEKWWDEFTPEIDELHQIGKAQSSLLVRKLERKLFLERVVPSQVRLLQEWYSLALNSWGVQLQRNARLPEARQRFVQALDLNTNNWAARMNLFSNTNLQSGTAMSLDGFGTLAGQIGRLDYLRSIMSRWGPLDEPSACHLLGYGFDQSRLRRQAMQQFNRAHELAPEALAPEFALAEIYSRCRLTNLASATLKHLHAEIDPLPDATNGAVQLALLEAHIRSAQTNTVAVQTNLPPAGL